MNSHAGQDALHSCLKAHDASSAGFEHNMQSLRVVDSLEESYPDFNGLNLTFETREGILKHCSRRNAVRIELREPGGVARRFVEVAGGLDSAAPRWLQPGLEAQLANLADEIAYNAHDIDDGVRSGLLTLEQLEEVALFSQFRVEAAQGRPALHGRRLLFETLRRMLSAQVYDVMDATRRAVARARPDDVEAACRLGPLVSFTPDMAGKSSELKQFLHRNLYRHPQVVMTTQAAQQVVRDLFSAYMNEPAQMAGTGHAALMAAGRTPARVVADYLAGMTDRFATREHERLTGRTAFAG